VVVQSKIFTKGDPEWLATRSRFITATEIAGLFALNPYSSPKKIYDNKIESSFQDNVYTRMGRILEPAVLNFARIELDVIADLFADLGDRIYFDETTKMSATPDAFIGESLDKAEALLELKTTSLEKARGWVESPPLHYLSQLAAQSALTGIHEGYLVVMVPRYPDLPGLIFKTQYEPEIGQLMAEEVSRFRAHYFWDLPKGKPTKKYMVDRKKCAHMRELLMQNVQIVHNSVTPPPEVEIAEFNWN
jgi:hypothetical protein